MGEPFHIRVPNLLNDRQLARFFRGWNWHEEPGDEIILDFSTVDFAALWTATMFGAYGRWLWEVRGRNVRVWLDEKTRAGAFLARVGLPQFVGDYSVREVAPAPERIVPLAQVRTSDQIQPVITSLMTVLSIEDGEMADAIRYSLVELLRNAVQHARSPMGAVVSAAYMPTTGMVNVSVADFGCGIRASLQERYPELREDDFKAVRFAMQPHVSGTFQRGAYESMANNAGLGLFFIKEIVTRSGGGFFLCSGRMLADLWGNADGTPGKRYFTAEGTGWRGVFALFQMRRDRIVEFDGLLQHCREIAAAVRKDPTELKLDFINEVPEMDGILVIRVKDFEENVERAAAIREDQIIPALADSGLVVLDFSGIRAATQSFAHALMYRLFRDTVGAVHALSIACADRATQEAIRVVAAYASSAK